MTEFHFSVCYNYILLSTQMPSVALYQAAPTSLTTDCNAVFLCCFFQSYQFDPDVCARLQNITQHGVIWSSFTTYHVKIFILMISIMGVDQKASGVQFCWCFYILILIYTVKYFYFYGDVLELFLGTSWCFLHTFLW